MKYHISKHSVGLHKIDHRVIESKHKGIVEFTASLNNNIVYVFIVIILATLSSHDAYRTIDNNRKM